jgi:hypothetical protein
VNEAEIRIAQELLPRDWTWLRDVVLRVGALFGRDLDLKMINRYLHEELLELMLVRPDGTMMQFLKEDCKHRTVHAAFKRAEGVWVEPLEAGRYLARLAELIPPAERVEPGRDVDADDAPVQGTQVKPGEPSELTPAADVGDQAGAANPSQPPPAALHPGGRPPVANWEMVEEEVFRLMNDNGEFSVDDPEWNAQARLEEAIGDFCENKFEKRPSETVIRDNIRKPLERWRQLRSET